MTRIFGLFLVTPCALTSCHIVISKQGNGRSRRCATGRRPHDMRNTQSDLDWVQRTGSRTSDTQPIRGVRSSLTIRLGRKWKRLHTLASGRRYGARRSPLSEYMSLHQSLKLTTNCVSLSRIKWEICFYIYVFHVVHKDTGEYTTIGFLS